MKKALLRQYQERRSRHEGEGTTAFRILDGNLEEEKLVTVDCFAGHWLVSSFGKTFPTELREPFSEAVSLSWKRLDQQDKDPPEKIWGCAPEEPFEVSERGLKYEIDFQSGYSQGIFLDQLENRSLVRSHSEGRRVLNLFSYTSAFSVAAGAGGAVTTSLDLSKRYLDWGKRNLELNDLDPKEHYFCKGDAFEWLARFRKSGRSFGGVILDPPTFSRGGKRKVFRAEEDYADLFAEALAVTDDKGWVLASTNCRRMDSEAFRTQIQLGLQAAGKYGEMEARPMPDDFDCSDYLKTLWVELV